MKNYLLTALAVLMLSVMNNADAQIGVKASGLLGTVYGESEEVNGEDIQSVGVNPGFNVGLFYRAGDGLIGFQGELLYEYRKTRTMVELASANIDVENKASLSYISLPLLATFDIGNLRPYVGLNVAYLVSAKGSRSGPYGTVVFDEDDEIDFQDDDTYDGGFFNTFEVGANVGIMFDISDAFYADLRISHSLTDVTNNDHDYTWDRLESREDYDKAFYLSLGVGFSLF